MHCLLRATVPATACRYSNFRDVTMQQQNGGLFVIAPSGGALLLALICIVAQPVAASVNARQLFAGWLLEIGDRCHVMIRLLQEVGPAASFAHKSFILRMLLNAFFFFPVPLAGALCQSLLIASVIS
jgi:hypothetical protein